MLLFEIVITLIHCISTDDVNTGNKNGVIMTPVTFVTPTEVSILGLYLSMKE